MERKSGGLRPGPSKFHLNENEEGEEERGYLRVVPLGLRLLHGLGRRIRVMRRDLEIWRGSFAAKEEERGKDGERSALGRGKNERSSRRIASGKDDGHAPPVEHAP